MSPTTSRTWWGPMGGLAAHGAGPVLTAVVAAALLVLLAIGTARAEGARRYGCWCPARR